MIHRLRNQDDASANVNTNNKNMSSLILQMKESGVQHKPTKGNRYMDSEMDLTNLRKFEKKIETSRMLNGIIKKSGNLRKLNTITNLNDSNDKKEVQITNARTTNKYYKGFRKFSKSLSLKSAGQDCSYYGDEKVMTKSSVKFSNRHRVNCNVNHLSRKNTIRTPSINISRKSTVRLSSKIDDENFKRLKGKSMTHVLNIHTFVIRSALYIHNFYILVYINYIASEYASVY